MERVKSAVNQIQFFGFWLRIFKFYFNIPADQISLLSLTGYSISLLSLTGYSVSLLSLTGYSISLLSLTGYSISLLSLTGYSNKHIASRESCWTSANSNRYTPLVLRCINVILSTQSPSNTLKKTLFFFCARFIHVGSSLFKYRQFHLSYSHIFPHTFFFRTNQTIFVILRWKHSYVVS
jgi:hypothetical protein